MIRSMIDDDDDALAEARRGVSNTIQVRYARVKSKGAEREEASVCVRACECTIGATFDVRWLRKGKGTRG